MKSIKEYTNILFGVSQHPKPKNWSRKNFKCSCNIPILSNNIPILSDNHNTLGRININYTVKIKNDITRHKKIKPDNWEVTHLEDPFKNTNIKYAITFGNIERGGSLTTTPLYIIIYNIEEYKNIQLKKERLNKLNKLKPVNKH